MQAALLRLRRGGGRWLTMEQDRRQGPGPRPPIRTRKDTTGLAVKRCFTAVPLDHTTNLPNQSTGSDGFTLALVKAGVVGAGGVEPPSSSVSDPTRLCRPVHRMGKRSGRIGGIPQLNAGVSAPTAPTVRHGPRRVVLITTAVDCCPSAARRTEPDLRDHNLNLSSVLSQLPEPKGPRPAVPANRWRPWVTADARARPL
jgi:hypothetical protein